MVASDLASWAIANSDPANLLLLTVIWRRLDRRMESLRRELLERNGSDASEAA